MIFHASTPNGTEIYAVNENHHSVHEITLIQSKFTDFSQKVQIAHFMQVSQTV